MDALKFLEEFDRMCVYYKDKICRGCPREGSPNCIIAAMGKEERAKLIRDVEQWSKEHPQRTRLQDLLEKYPSVKLNSSGYTTFCCQALGYCDECLHGGIGCKDCWNMPVEEDE